MHKYEVTIGIVGKDIFLEDGLTHYDYTGRVAEQWTLDGVLSRPTGPALTVFRSKDIDRIEFSNTFAEFCYKDGKLHEGYWIRHAYMVKDPEYGYEETRSYMNGLLHADDGPAIINQFERQYFVHGVEFGKEEFYQRRNDEREKNRFRPASPS